LEKFNITENSIFFLCKKKFFGKKIKLKIEKLKKILEKTHWEMKSPFCP
jgi:hypothetical protein